MQETDFIFQNKEKWKEFEGVLKSKNKDPERITDLFIETTDDLSYSRTFYPNRSVRVYLNGIAQQVYQSIYKNRSGEKNIFKRFWLEDLPAAMWHSRKALLWSFLLFVAGLTVGIMSSIYYPEFARIILGDQYIEMTEANIASGDPMAVYKDDEPVLMFLQIAWNNIRIAFGTFVLGILFGIGTVYVVFYNAIMVGAFVYFFIERGLFRESFLAIMLHGTLELSMIVVAGCAGFALARGLLFPGTYTRGQALVHSARNGIKILVGVTVLLIYAAIIESFATRYTEIPDVIRALIILLSFTVVIGYFVVYPRYLKRKGMIGHPDQEEIPGSHSRNYKLHSIKSPGKIFTEIFSIFSANSRKTALFSLLLALIVTVAFGLFTNGEYHKIFETGDTYGHYNPLGPLYVWDTFHYHLQFDAWPLAYPLFVALFSIYVVYVFRLTNQQFDKSRKSTLANITSIFLISLLLSLTLFLPGIFTFLAMLILFPIALMWMYIAMNEDLPFLKSMSRTLKLLRGNFWRVSGSFISTLAVQWIGLMIVSSQILMLMSEFIQLNIPRFSGLAPEIPGIIYTFIAFYVLSFILCLSLYGTALLYYSNREVNEASALLASIEKIGFRKRAYGLEQES